MFIHIDVRIISFPPAYSFARYKLNVKKNIYKFIHYIAMDDYVRFFHEKNESYKKDENYKYENDKNKL